MSELTISREQLNSLIISESARAASDVTRIINDIYLTYRRSEIVTPRAPALRRPQHIISMTLDSVTYLDRPSWTLAWQRIYAENQRLGVEVFPDRATEIQNQNITNSLGVPLPLLTPATISGTRPEPGSNNLTLSVVGSKGAPGVGIGSINIDSNGDLIVDLDNGQTVNAGQAVPTISIGTVTQNPSGLGSSATLTGTAPDYVLNLELDTSATTGNFVGTVLLTSQGLTADSATRKDYVDQQITQTANQTKINNLAFSIVFGA